jgi:hypothetical protein
MTDTQTTIACLEQQRRFLIQQAIETNTPNPNGIAVIDRAIDETLNPDAAVARWNRERSTVLP